ncbi:hypothetical protein Cgig2_009425 [Carnegiea gigantea]|uniref:Uncharacterized protein n=1 Tax=Carnegiea gigantea TaxID=171969 RepID=A0A9Q1JSV4_9CARY|nr:hypothetical protein Cgig2_009425 [Carnegiea gigantea]
MVTFMNKITRGRRYLHVQPSENDVDGEDMKLPIHNPITSVCKSDCVRGPPSLLWRSTENLKTGETFLLSTHIKMKENLPSYQLLRHDIESECKLWATVAWGIFLQIAYWEWLEDILVRCKDKLTTFHLFDSLHASLFLYDRCSNLIQAGKPTIKQWIAFWFRERNRYHVARKPDQDSRIPHPGILSSIINAEVLRDASCIRPDTFSVASFMASGVGYCLSTAILTSIYKGLDEISRSSHPGRGGGHFPAHFLYAWLAKNFNVYELVGEASSSPGMVNFSGIG